MANKRLRMRMTRVPIVHNGKVIGIQTTIDAWSGPSPDGPEASEVQELAYDLVVKLLYDLDEPSQLNQAN